MDAVTPTARPVNLAIALRVLSRLLAYPDDALRRDLPDIRAALQVEHALGTARKQQLYGLIDELESGEALVLESAFVDLFDRGRATSLHLFEHVHGDSRERGPAMVDLAQTYAAAGLTLAPGELPDYLPVIVEFVSTQTSDVARAFLGEMAQLLAALHDALGKRQSQYASILAALLDLCGESAEQSVAPVPASVAAIDKGIDADWAEPAAFAGCANLGQTGAGRAATQAIAQPIHFVPARSSGVAQSNAAANGVSP
jgi:nitrate reductase delta subunit